MNKNRKYISYDKNLTDKARENRKNPTAAERKLWYEMLAQKSFMGLKFTRQKPIDRYIVDFYCSELMLVIEIDGDSHAEQEEYDKQRTERLNKYGITVFRYTNRDILYNLSGVYEDLCEKIEELRKKLK